VLFKLAQQSFNKGFEHYGATVGLTVFAHNLPVLTRDTS